MKRYKEKAGKIYARITYTDAVGKQRRFGDAPKVRPTRKTSPDNSNTSSRLKVLRRLSIMEPWTSILISGSSHKNKVCLRALWKTTQAT